MKKVMIVAVAALCATVGFADGAIESANIVGYQEVEVQNATGYNFIIPTFTDVSSGTATYNLQNIKLVGAAGDGYSDTLVGYDSSACLSGVDYYWTTTEAGGEVDGWTEAGGSELIEDVTLPIGSGLYLQLISEGVKVLYSGQVYDGETITSAVLPVGYNMVGNATPKAIDLQDLKLLNAAGDGYSDTLVGYDSNACLSGVDYYWTTTEGGGEVDGWTEAGGSELISDVTLQPGQGVYLQLISEGVQFTIPGALATK